MGHNPTTPATHDPDQHPRGELFTPALRYLSESISLWRLVSTVWQQSPNKQSQNTRVTVGSRHCHQDTPEPFHKGAVGKLWLPWQSKPNLAITPSAPLCGIHIKTDRSPVYPSITASAPLRGIHIKTDRSPVYLSSGCRNTASVPQQSARHLLRKSFSGKYLFWVYQKHFRQSIHTVEYRCSNKPLDTVKL